MPGPQFVLYVFKDDLYVEIPSYDNDTLDDQRLQLQQNMREEIRNHLQSRNLQTGGEDGIELSIHQRMTAVFKIHIVPGRVQEALNIITEYLAARGISVDILSLNVVQASGVALRL